MVLLNVQACNKIVKLLVAGGPGSWENMIWPGTSPWECLQVFGRTIEGLEMIRLEQLKDVGKAVGKGEGALNLRHNARGSCSLRQL